VGGKGVRYPFWPPSDTLFSSLERNGVGHWKGYLTPFPPLSLMLLRNIPRGIRRLTDTRVLPLRAVDGDRLWTALRPTVRPAGEKPGAVALTMVSRSSR